MLKYKYSRVPLFCIFNDAVDKFLNNVVTMLLDNNEIADVKHEYCQIFILFDNGFLVEAWNSNKWYAWFSEGEICKYNAETGKRDETFYKWKSGRIRRKTMNRLLKKIEDFQMQNLMQKL